jgi:Flp pilus assembly pilin Flp
MRDDHEIAGRNPVTREAQKGVSCTMTFTEWFAFACRNRRKEEGQTMAEYAVVLGVVCVLTVGAFTALHSAIASSIDAVTSLIP